MCIYFGLKIEGFLCMLESTCKPAVMCTSENLAQDMQANRNLQMSLAIFEHSHKTPLLFIGPLADFSQIFIGICGAVLDRHAF